MPHLRLSLLLCGILAAPAAAQQAKKDETARLAQLLAELRKISPAAWQAQLTALDKLAKGHEARARALSAQARQETAKAKAVRERAARLKQAMALLASQKPAQAKPKPKPTRPKPKTARKPKAKTQPKPAAKATARPKATAMKPKPGPKAPARGTAKAKTKAPAAPLITYDDHVQEVFMNQCSACHDPDSKEGGLDLTSFATALAGGGSGTTIVPGNLERSRLYKLVAHLEKPTMPPDEPPIPKEQIQLIAKWIQAGAPENKTAARRLAAKQAAAPKPKPVAAKPRFDRPAPMPKGWPEVELQLPAQDPPLRGLAASPRSSLLAHAGFRQVLLRSSADLEPMVALDFEPGEVELLRFSTDASTLLIAGGIAGKRGRLQLVDVASGEVRATLGRMFDTPLAAALHPGLQMVALGGSNRRLEVLDVQSGKSRLNLKHSDWVLSCDFSPDGAWLASGDRKGALLLTRTKDARTLHSLSRHRGAVTAVCCSPDSQSVLSAGLDGSLRLTRLRDGRELWRRSAGAALCAAFSPDGKLCAAAGKDGRIRVYRSSGGGYGSLPALGEWIYSLSFSADGKTLFAGDYRGRLTSFDLGRRRQRDQRSALPRPEGG